MKKILKFYLIFKFIFYNKLELNKFSFNFLYYIKYKNN